MSYNHNIYNNFHNNTFQGNGPYLVPPPPPPPFFGPVAHKTIEQLDQEFVKHFESNIPLSKQKVLNTKSVSISQLRADLCKIVTMLNNLKNEEKLVRENIETLKDDAWAQKIKIIKENKGLLKKMMGGISLHTDNLRKALGKRMSKRIRLKRLREERKRMKEEIVREMEETSRKIDENLQKIKDDINKAKQEEEAKLQADVMLKEVVRKKLDAKKYISKMEALMKLRRARENTAKGRGELVSQNEAQIFDNNIERLKSLWVQKLSAYEKEELDVRQELAKVNAQVTTTASESEREASCVLSQWLATYFGGSNPQVDFKNDVTRFIAVRSEWDRYLSPEGSTIPVGWVPPSKALKFN